MPPPVAEPAAEAGEQEAAARRITLTLLLAQSLGSAGFLVASTVNPLVGAHLGGGPAWAGTPTATYQAGAAAVAFGWGLAMDRIGRRRTLSLGLAVGAVGAALACRGVMGSRLGLFLAGVGLMGMAHSALQLGRFVAAEVHPPARRARAIATVVVGGTVGAVFGPMLVGPAGAWARRLGLDELSGPYAVSCLLFAAVVALVWVRLVPDPRELSRAFAPPAGPSSGTAEGGRRGLGEILRQPVARLAVITLVFAQAVMVMLMVITSVHMRGHDHALSGIAFVISSHVVGMYAFSVVSGRLSDRFGRRSVIVAGAAFLALSCLLAPLSPRVLPLAAALFLLGLGWNFCYVAGSALLSDSLRPAERARTQGFNDFLIGLASALGALGSGAVFAAIGYGAMGVVAGAASVVPLVLALRHETAAGAGAPPEELSSAAEPG